MFYADGSFSRVDDGSPSPPIPRGSRRKHGSSSNPYSARGLDKFFAVRADLQSRRERIMAEAGAQGAPLVRFVYSNADGWVPIVVRPRDQGSEVEMPKKNGAAAEAGQKKPSAAAEATPSQVAKKRFSWKVQGREGSTARFSGWRPPYYWPAVVVLILLCLVFGRAFAICCTYICWYLVPCMEEGKGPNMRKKLVNKDRGLGWPRHHKAGAAKRRSLLNG